MRYKNCPQCGGMNREGDAKCYQCEAVFDALPPKPVGSSAVEAAPLGSRNPMPDPGEFNLAEVLKESFILYGKTFPRLLALSCVVAAVVVVLGLGAVLLLKAGTGPLGLIMMGLPCCSFLMPFFWAAHMRILLAQQRGESTTLGECLSSGLVRGLGLFITLIVVGLGLMMAYFVFGLLGIMLLGRALFFVLVPLLLYLCASWYLYVPCVVLEDQLFFSGLSRSSQLVDGVRLQMLVLSIATGFIVNLGVQLPLQAVGNVIGAMMGFGDQALIPGVALLTLASIGGLALTGFHQVVPFVAYMRLTRGRAISCFM